MKINKEALIKLRKELGYKDYQLYEGTRVSASIVSRYSKMELTNLVLTNFINFIECINNDPRSKKHYDYTDFIIN